jgi:hypothetical protein
MTQHDEDYEAGKRAAARELQPLVDAISDAIFMFNDIAKARQLPATAQAVQQYVSMGKQLERCLKLSGLLKWKTPEQTPMNWCEPCQSYHSETAPGCFKNRTLKED